MSGRGLSPAGSRFDRCFEAVVVHSLVWLVAGNLVGVLLATLLLEPALGGWLGVLSYGRWMPVHLNIQLYGWCALPLVGMLLWLYLDGTRERRLGTVALGVWSGSLLFGCLSWLLGQSSGKPFLEWSGPAVGVLAAGMMFLGLVLLRGFIRQAREWKRCSSGGRAGVVAKGALLTLLLLLPALIYRVAQPDVYPPYNPRSGGATGGSLLGSTLVVVAIFLVTPLIMRLERRTSLPRLWRLMALLAVHFAWFAALDHGNRSHHEWLQILSLASLAFWPPLLWRLFRAYRWPLGSRLWLGSLAVWGVALVSTGFVSFLPGVLEREKFTNALVGHAHLAMAGMATSFCMLVLIGLNAHGRLWELLAKKRPFALWQIGCALQVVALLVLGGLESTDVGLLYRFETAAQSLYLARWLGGSLMLAGSAEWLTGAIRRMAPASLPTSAAEGLVAR